MNYLTYASEQIINLSSKLKKISTLRDEIKNNLWPYEQTLNLDIIIENNESLFEEKIKVLEEYLEGLEESRIKPSSDLENNLIKMINLLGQLYTMDLEVYSIIQGYTKVKD